VSCPDAIIYHYHHLRFRTFCSQHFYYGRGGFRHRYLAAGRHWRRLQFEKFSFYLGLFSWAFRSLPLQMALRVTPLLALSHLVQLAGFLWEAARTLVVGRQEERSRRPEPARGPFEAVRGSSRRFPGPHPQP
jgi:GT2 family glycosyltransferase